MNSSSMATVVTRKWLLRTSGIVSPGKRGVKKELLGWIALAIWLGKYMIEDHHGWVQAIPGVLPGDGGGTAWRFRDGKLTESKAFVIKTGVA